MMKKITLLLALGTIGLAACKKGTSVETNGCISQVRRHNITGADSLAAVNLLQQNNISPAHLSFYQVTLKDSFFNEGAYIKLNTQHLFAIQYFNGLPVFSSDMAFHFRDNIFNYASGQRYASVNLNTAQKTSLQQVRRAFIIASGNDSTLRKSCLSAEFGYFNLTPDSSPPNFIKAWYVTPQNQSYPMAMIRDDNGAVLFYYDGIMTLD